MLFLLIILSENTWVIGLHTVLLLRDYVNFERQLSKDLKHFSCILG